MLFGSITKINFPCQAKLRLSNKSNRNNIPNRWPNADWKLQKKKEIFMRHAEVTKTGAISVYIWHFSVKCTHKNWSVLIVFLILFDNFWLAYTYTIQLYLCIYDSTDSIYISFISISMVFENLLCKILIVNYTMNLSWPYALDGKLLIFTKR